MPRYRFVGAFETVLLGLQNGVNAKLLRYDRDGAEVDPGQPDESTVVVQPGDLVVTDELYISAQLVEVETGLDRQSPQMAATAADAPVGPEVPTEPDSSQSAETAPGTTADFATPTAAVEE